MAALRLWLASSSNKPFWSAVLRSLVAACRSAAVAMRIPLIKSLVFIILYVLNLTNPGWIDCHGFAKSAFDFGCEILCASPCREAFGVRRIPAMCFLVAQECLGRSKRKRRNAAHSKRFARFGCG